MSWKNENFETQIDDRHLRAVNLKILHTVSLGVVKYLTRKYIQGKFSMHCNHKDAWCLGRMRILDLRLMMARIRNTIGETKVYYVNIHIC